MIGSDPSLLVLWLPVFAMAMSWIVASSIWNIVVATQAPMSAVMTSISAPALSAVPLL